MLMLILIQHSLVVIQMGKAHVFITERGSIVSRHRSGGRTTGNISGQTKTTIAISIRERGRREGARYLFISETDDGPPPRLPNVAALVVF